MIQPSDKVQEFIMQHADDDVRELALKAKSYPGLDFGFIIRQIAGRQIAKKKIPSWYAYLDILYPVHLSLEQASSERAAVYKASLLKNGGIFIDLTGGLGVDFSFMSRSADKAIYVEKQQKLVDIAKLNFEVLGLKNIETVREDAVEYLKKLENKADIIYIDPARRDNADRKIFLIEDCIPDLTSIDTLLGDKSEATLIKLSPMLDITLALHSLKNISQVHIVSVNNETKELLLIKEKTGYETTIHCVNLLADKREESFVFTRNEEESAVVRYTDSLEEYLYEPNSSIMKAGAYKSIASAFSLDKLHINSHLYTSDVLIEDFPGRKFKVKNVFSLSKKDMRTHLKGITQANITVRNFPLTVAGIRKQTKLKEGSTDYIFATTLSNGKKVLILGEKIG